MRLLSLTVRNYRIHRETAVAFDPARTLIGGPNESGKSTLADAARNALFLPAKTGGKIQKAMLNERLPAIPEVELSFEAGGTTYHLHKRFGGNTKGTVVLRADNGHSWQGSEAESRLAELLGGSGPGDAVPPWSHLWIRQGESGNDPSDEATSRKDALISRLQKDGAAIVMQSELDSRVAAGFHEEAEAVFNTRGVVKNSELARAGQAAGEAERELAAARETALRLERAMNDCQAAEAALAAVAKALPDLQAALHEAEGKLARATELKLTEQTRQLAAASAAKQHDELAKADREIRRLERDLADAKAEIEPKRGRLGRLEAETAAARDRARDAEKALDLAGTAHRDARLRLELARLHAERHELESRLAPLRERSARVLATREELKPLDAALAALPKLTAADLKQLQKLEAGRATAAAALQAMATGIEAVAGTATLDGATLTAGQARVLSETTELRVGDAVLRIHPGGGNRLADARLALREAGDARQRALDSLGLDSLAAAQQVHERREALERKIDGLRSRIEAMAPDAIARDLAQAEASLDALLAEIARREPALAGFVPPAGARDATHALAAAREAAAAAEDREASAKSALGSAQAAATRAAELLESERTALHGEEGRILATTQRIGMLADHFGDSARRADALPRALQAMEESAGRLAEIRHQLAALQPDLLAGDRDRLKRSIERQQATRSEASQALAGAKALLASDGTHDPEAALALAEARAASAREHLAAVHRRAEAIRTLDTLFRAEQGRLAEQFTAPLAERITDYLRCLFGPDAHARVRLEGEKFGGLELVRRGSETFGFELLSGGTREQLAAAVRLAIAEILAADHDGCLPVIFDDAFSFSDPERVQALQRMLDHAAKRGLQIIVLTCTPADYAAFGAAELRL
jgi:DNA repair exonuclease SbcCD ATPase subunit